MKKVLLMLGAAAGLATMVYVESRAAESTPWEAPARASRRKNPVAADAASIQAGKVVFEKECVTCHGAAGNGNGPQAKDLTVPPGDLSSAKVQGQSDGALFWKITEGRKPMPSYDKMLSEEQRWQVVNYVRTLAAKGGTK